MTDEAKWRIFWVAEAAGGLAVAALCFTLIRTGDVPRQAIWTFLLVLTLCIPVTLWCSGARRRVREERRQSRIHVAKV
jgi:hypothetical protein